MEPAAMAKRVPPLTSAQVNSLKPDVGRTLELVDGAVPGLRLRMLPSGDRTWSLNMRAKGKMRRFSVGSGLGLAEARRLAEVMRQDIRRGADPTAERRAQRAAVATPGAEPESFAEIIERYYGEGPGAGLRSKLEQVKRLRSVFAKQLHRPGLELDGVELQLTVDAHPSKTAAARAVAYLGPVLKWAARRSLVPAAFILEKPHAHDEDDDGGVGQRILSRDELRRLLPALVGPYGLCCRFLLLTAARLREATDATWSEVDLTARTWTIPPTRRKNTRSRLRRKQVPTPPHVIPLPRQAVDLLLKAQQADLMHRHLEGKDAVINPNDRIFVGGRGGKLENWDRWLKTVFATTGVRGWSAHTMRRTSATIAGDLGAPTYVAAAILGHKNIGSPLIAGYNKSRYRSEHMEALQGLADHLDDIAADPRPGTSV
jgi:integrase